MPDHQPPERSGLRLLLGTRPLLWWATLDPRLSERVLSAILDERTDVAVSAASAWAIVTSARQGRPVWPQEAGTVRDYVRDQGFRTLAISLEHAERAAQLSIASRDPVARILIAQAQLDDLWLVSEEPEVDAAGVHRYW